jgi:hypothetical protein
MHATVGAIPTHITRTVSRGKGITLTSIKFYTMERQMIDPDQLLRCLLGYFGMVRTILRELQFQYDHLVSPSKHKTYYINNFL